MKKITFPIACFIASCVIAQDNLPTGYIPMPSQHGSCDVKELLQNHHPVGEAHPRRRSHKLLGTEKEYVLWIDRLTNMPEYLRELYDQIGADIQKVLSGASSPLSDPELRKVSEGTYAYTVKTFTGSAPFTYTSSSDLQQNAANAVMSQATAHWDQYVSFVPYLCVSINMDHPEAFWLNTKYSYFYTFGITYSYDESTRRGTSQYEITVYFSIKDNDQNYDLRRNEFQSPAHIQQGVSQFHTAVRNILSGCPDTGSRYDKLLYLNDWLTSHNSYNSQSDESLRPDIAWSPFSALTGSVAGSGPVCEGYSRAFKVLCDQINIPCTLVSGWARNNQTDSGEAHMWNQVKMADGQWYAIDVTWNDPVTGGTAAQSGAETHQWFLLGSETDIQPGFPFSASHIEDPFGGFSSQGSYSWNAQPAPTLSTSRYEAGSDIPDDPNPEDPHTDLITVEDITNLIDKYLAQ